MYLVIFDLDGVIIDSAKVKLQAFQETFIKFHLGQLPDKSELLQTTKPSEIFLNYSNNIRKMSTFFSDKFEDNLVKAKRLIDLKKIKLYKSSNLRFALFTAQPIKRVKMLFSNSELKLFDKIITEEDIKENSKDKSNKISHLLRILNPKMSYFIGDTIDDIKAAKSSSIKSIFVAWGFTNKQEILKYEPDIIWEKTNELFTFLEKLRNGNRLLCSNKRNR